MHWSSTCLSRGCRCAKRARAPTLPFNGQSTEQHQDPHRPQLYELCIDIWMTESLTTSCGLSVSNAPRRSLSEPCNAKQMSPTHSSKTTPNCANESNTCAAPAGKPPPNSPQPVGSGRWLYWRRREDSNPHPAA